MKFFVLSLIIFLFPFVTFATGGDPIDFSGKGDVSQDGALKPVDNTGAGVCNECSADKPRSSGPLHRYSRKGAISTRVADALPAGTTAAPAPATKDDAKSRAQ